MLVPDIYFPIEDMKSCEMHEFEKICTALSEPDNETHTNNHENNPEWNRCDESNESKKHKTYSDDDSKDWGEKHEFSYSWLTIGLFEEIFYLVDEDFLCHFFEG